MFIKLLGSSFIVFSGTYIGFALAKQCSDRLISLRQILSCIVALRSYMNYTAMELGDSMIQCASGANRKVAAFFLSVASLLKKNYLITPKEAIIESLKIYKNQLALTKEDCEVLILFGCNLGQMNKQEQENYLLMIEKRLEILEREAANLRDKNSKMYRYLGICASMLIVLLLI